MQRQSETSRIEAFSDGVFAIAITLLVIEVKVPENELVDRIGLSCALLEIWPSYLAFLTSFASILVFWIHHHWIFSLINKSDVGLFYLNGILLLFITFIPFPTALLSEYLLHRDARVAASFYTGVFFAISLSFDFLWRYVSVKLLSKDDISVRNQEALQITRHYRFGPLLYVAAFAMSFVSEPLSVSLCLLLAVFFSFRRWSLTKVD